VTPSLVFTAKSKARFGDSFSHTHTQYRIFLSRPVHVPLGTLSICFGDNPRNYSTCLCRIRTNAPSAWTPCWEGSAWESAHRVDTSFTSVASGTIARVFHKAPPFVDARYAQNAAAA
jgi:hypothetical protein